jgi:hypothetical protein
MQFFLYFSSAATDGGASSEPVQFFMSPNVQGLRRFLWRNRALR